MRTAISRNSSSSTAPLSHRFSISTHAAATTVADGTGADSPALSC